MRLICSATMTGQDCCVEDSSQVSVLLWALPAVLHFLPFTAGPLCSGWDCFGDLASCLQTGLIFHANIIAVNQFVFFPSRDTNIVLDILRVFIEWLNLDLGIETCFYDGMDAYARTWLQFIFPVYIWVLVCTVIILSYYKTWAVRMFGRNPVADLATLSLLSYAKLLRTIITAFSFTFLDYPDGSEVAVWLYDGNVRYLQGKHIPLLLVAMVFLLLLFLPYTVVLSLGQWNQARSRSRLFSWI